MFGSQPLEPKFASLTEQIRADFALLVGRKDDPVWPPFQPPREIGFAQT